MPSQQQTESEAFVEQRRQEEQTRQGWTTRITLRDYFAAKAMHAILELANTERSSAGEIRIETKLITQAAYKIADAMLEARNQ